MASPKKTATNPYGLSAKQRLVVADIARNAHKTGKIDLFSAHKKVYSTDKVPSIHRIKTDNMQKENFREALLEELYEKNILGAGGKVNSRLIQGLDAENKEGEDYNTRLKYIQEIHKVAGVYAPQKIEKRSMSLHADLSEKELDQRIQELNEELNS